MRRFTLALILALSALALAGCRFALVESGSVRIEAPTEAPGAAEAASGQP